MTTLFCDFVCLRVASHIQKNDKSPKIGKILFFHRLGLKYEWEESIFHLKEGPRFRLSFDHLQLSSSIHELLSLNRDLLLT